MTGDSVWVLDCSAAVAFLLREEESDALDALILRAARDEVRLVVPALFWFELLNALVMAERRGRITRPQAISLRNDVAHLPIEVEPPLGASERARIHDLATAHHLTAYDAAYLELAERIGARLKTLDPDLIKWKKKYAWIG